MDERWPGNGSLFAVLAVPACLLFAAQPVVGQYSQRGCPPCASQSHVLPRLMKDYNVEGVDLHRCPAATGNSEVRVTPTILIEVDGNEEEPCEEVPSQRQLAQACKDQAPAAPVETHVLPPAKPMSKGEPENPKKGARSVPRSPQRWDPIAREWVPYGDQPRVLIRYLPRREVVEVRASNGPRSSVEYVH